jgi:hypothetical protein
MKRIVASPPLIALALALVAHPAQGDTSDVEELKKMMKAMQKTIADQNARINAQSARIATLEKQQHAPPTKGAAPAVVTTTSTAPASDRSVSILGKKVPTGELPGNAVPAASTTVRDRDDFSDLQQAAPRPNNAPLDPALKGFVPIPGTDSMFKIGGSARIDAITDFHNNGNPNLFIPSSIPVQGEPGWDGRERSTLEAKGTRLSFEFRRPVPFDDTLRIYTEYDFFDNSTSSSMSFRVRHFYGQAWNFLIGQTFSAFMDPDVFPDTVDYQGPNGIVNRRQPQIRYTHPIYQGASKVLGFASVEQPDSQIDTSTDEFQPGASTVTRIPDTVVGLRWEGEAGHLQATGLFREISFETDGGPRKNVFGWGASLSGELNVFKDDNFSLQATYGEGVARYINDLGGEDLDAALDDHGRLVAIPVFAAMGGYTHQWNKQWRSTISGGYVHSDSPDTLGPFALDNTIYASGNLVWHPTSSFRMGLEYLYGRKETIDGSERDAHRIDFVIRYDLVR